MIFKDIRHHLSILRSTPLHPQWLVFKQDYANKKMITPWIQGKLLDIGCGNKPLLAFLGPKIEYLGMDYPDTVAKGYLGQADVFGDGQKLPFKEASFNTITLLDVMEHLPRPEDTVKEMLRVARPGGIMIIQTPFLYPLHDLPHDYQRWTASGLNTIGERHAIEQVALQPHGRPLETAAALTNMALAKGILGCFENRHAGLLLLPLAVVAIPFINVCGWLLARLLPDDNFMPLGYTVIFRKRN